MQTPESLGGGRRGDPGTMQIMSREGLASGFSKESGACGQGTSRFKILETSAQMTLGSFPNARVMGGVGCGSLAQVCPL